MKKTRSLLAMLAVLALLVSVWGIPAFAAETLESNFDFTKLEENTDRDAVKATLQGMGLYEAHNLLIDGNHEPILQPGGYAGEGYIIHKLEAGADKTLAAAKLNLGYWICNGDPQGYIEVHTSADNSTYEKVWECREGNGPAFENTRRTADIDLPLNNGQTTLYVKVVMQHWNTCEGAGVAFSNLSATVVDPNAEPVDGPVASHYDFTKLQESTDRDAVKATLQGMGLYEAHNLLIDGNHEPIIQPGGYAGEGYIIHKLEAGADKTLAAAKLDLGYWICNGDPQGYIEVYTSADNASYSKVWECREGNGPAFENTRRTADIDLPLNNGQNTLYVKVVMQHWNTCEGAGVAFSNLSATVVDPNAEPVDGPMASHYDFTKLEENTDRDAVKATLQGMGLYEAHNLLIDGNHEPIIQPGGYAGNGYIIHKLQAGQGQILEGAKLDLGYWICNGDPQGYIEVYTSADNSTYEKVWECREGNGPAFEDTRQNAAIDLPLAEGQTVLYVKVVMEHWNTCEGAGVAYSNVSVNAKTPEPDPTGDMISVFAALAVVCAAGIVVTSKKIRK